MASNKRVAQIKTVASIASLITVASILGSSANLRGILRSIFAPREHPVRFATLIVALILNAKSLPLIWHLRFLKAMITQIYWRSTPLPRDALFRPMVTKAMYTPTNETDYNGHKSNSTYFADLDIARTQHISALLSHGIRNAASGTHRPLELRGDIPDAALQTTVNGNGASLPPPNKGGKVVFAIALGAVSCHFKREIKPYERFDIWTRILSWDQKWIYQVTHMVRPGAVPPDHVALQPWKAGAAAGAQRARHDVASAEQRAAFKSAIFATSISKYVVKRGRQTVPPELVFQSSHLLPPMPGQGPNENSRKPVSGAGVTAGWTWEGVEAERVRGLELARHFAALDADGGLHDEFPVAHMPSENGLEILGEFRDLYL